jgi:flagellum-specific peptidoglycan hydrolase FlgJ
MKIKLFVILFVVLFLSSCGSKKKVITSTKKEKRVVVVDVPKKVEAKKNTTPKTYSEIKQNYIEQYSEIAMEEMLLYKIPASITLAQGVLESRSGTSELTLKSNNHFGIKCHKGWKGEKTAHDDDLKGECFRVYKHPSYSFRDHSLFLYERKRYMGLFKLKITNYIGWAKGLRNAGYATDKAYPKKLIKIIEDYELYKYDAIALGKTVDGIQNVKHDSHTVVKGDTLYSLSRKYNLTVKELKEINGFTDNTISVGQKLYLTKL